MTENTSLTKLNDLTGLVLLNTNSGNLMYNAFNVASQVFNRQLV